MDIALKVDERMEREKGEMEAGIRPSAVNGRTGKTALKRSLVACVKLRGKSPIELQANILWAQVMRN
jgi:hypothetical protein